MNQVLRLREKTQERKKKKKKKRIPPRIKILFHIIAFSLFLFGAVILHVVFNHTSSYLNFFGNNVHRNVVFNVGIICIGIGFFIEFFLSFKPISIN